MPRIPRALGLSAVAIAFLAASLAPCPSARAVRIVGTDLAISAPCPCHCGEHAVSAASALDPALVAASAPCADRARAVPPTVPEPAASSAPLSIPDPVPIAS
jgi:hypothetical protein